MSSVAQKRPYSTLFYSRMWLAIPRLLMSRAWILCASESRLPRAVSSKQTMQVCYYHEFNPHSDPHHLHSFAPATQVSTAVSEKLRPCYLNGIYETHMACSAISNATVGLISKCLGLKKLWWKSTIIQKWQALHFLGVWWSIIPQKSEAARCTRCLKSCTEITRFSIHADTFFTLNNFFLAMWY